MGIPVVMDVDTGIDDAMAILFTAKHPDLDLLAISCVAGNTDVANVAQNTLKILDLAQYKDVPVALGASKPLIDPARPASDIHGADGMADLPLPKSPRPLAQASAVEVLYRTIAATAQQVVLIATAPLTNIAALIVSYPQIKNKISQIVFMGGAIGCGNATPVAEFNVWHDPIATQIVLQSGIKISMYGLDVFNKVAVTSETIAKLDQLSNPIATALHQLLGFKNYDAITKSWVEYSLIGDAGAVCALTCPQLFNWEHLPVSVNLSEGASRGQTMVDTRKQAGNLTDWPKISIATQVDSPAVLRLFFNTVLGTDQANQLQLP